MLQVYQRSTKEEGDIFGTFDYERFLERVTQTDGIAMILSEVDR